jgi:hypothetical protein
MNKRIKEVIVVIHQHKILYADTNINSFYRILKALEKTTPHKETIKKHLDKAGVYFFTNEFGSVYQICKYENSNYVGLK